MSVICTHAEILKTPVMTVFLLSFLSCRVSQSLPQYKIAALSETLTSALMRLILGLTVATAVSICAMMISVLMALCVTESCSVKMGAMKMTSSVVSWLACS